MKRGGRTTECMTPSPINEFKFNGSVISSVGSLYVEDLTNLSNLYISPRELPMVCQTMCRRPTMRHPSIVVGCLLWLCSVLSEAQPGPCEADSSEIGFGTIAEVNSAMAAELARIQGGSQPQNEYTFNLCSQRVYDTESEPLRPVLSNLFVVCGPDGTSKNQCTFLGGDVQVEVRDSTVPSYPLADITLSGITFADFKNLSVAAFASSSSKLNLMDVVFTGFNADFVVKQSNGDETNPMNVEVTECAINAGTVGSVFSNDGGHLTVSKLIVSDMDAASLISTSNEGVSFLQDSSITDSAFDSVTTTTSGGAQSVFKLEVTQMRRIQDSFKVDQPLSRLILNTVSVTNNNITTDTPWTGVVAQGGATATVGDYDFSTNRGVESAIFVSGGASLSLLDSFIGSNLGAAMEENARPSAAAFALSNGSLVIERTEFIGNTDFSAEVLVLLKSTVNLTKSCIQDGSDRFVVFVDSSSTYAASLNFINNFDSERCPASDPMLRLFKENPDSGCFVGGNVCEGTCEEVADQTVCLAQVVPTGQPLSSRPSTAPTPLPNSTMPVTQPPSRPPIAPITSAPTIKAPTPLIPPHATVRPTSLCPGKSKKGKRSKKGKSMKSKKAKGPPLPPKGKGKGDMGKGGMMGMSCGKGDMSKGTSSKIEGKGKGGKGGDSKSFSAKKSKSRRRTAVRSLLNDRGYVSGHREPLFWDRQRRIQEQQNQHRDLRGSSSETGVS